MQQSRQALPFLVTGFFLFVDWLLGLMNVDKGSVAKPVMTNGKQ